MELSRFRALSFDCYGTLIDWETGISAVLTPWAHAHGLDVDEENLLAAYGHHESRLEEQTPDALYTDIVARTMTALGDEFGAPVTEEDSARLAASVPHWPPFPDAQQALVSLAERYKLIILSNVDRKSFHGTNKRLGIAFTEVITAEDVGSYKPAARNFETLIERATQHGIGEGELLHVAQSLFHDHAPAKAAGLPTVFINRRHSRPGLGATPAPTSPVVPDWEFPSMQAFAAAAHPQGNF
jgi:2-haloacid dehalogenase